MEFVEFFHIFLVHVLVIFCGDRLGVGEVIIFSSTMVPIGVIVSCMGELYFGITCGSITLCAGTLYTFTSLCALIVIFCSTLSCDTSCFGIIIPCLEELCIEKIFDNFYSASNAASPNI